MTRPWGKQYAHMLNHPKYLRLTISARAAWHTLFLVALNSPAEEVLGDRADVEAILRNYGHGDQVVIDVSLLIDRGLIDVRSGTNGKLKLHDWNHWQPSDPTGAKRKQAQRLRGQARDVPQPVNGLSRDSHALDGDGESDRDSTPPTPSPARGRPRRSKASTGVDPSQYDRATIRDPDDGEPAWVRASAEAKP